MNNLARKKILLISEKNDFPKKHAKHGFYWVYFGRDYEHLLQLKKTIPAGFKFVDIGKLLYPTSYKLRRSYIDFIGTLSTQFASLSWWISPIAEKNVMASPVFLYVCYLEIIKQLKNSELKGKNICIFSESPALLETIAKSGLFSDYSIHKYYKRGFLRSYFKAFPDLIQFIRQSLSRKLYAKLTRKYEKNSVRGQVSPLVILRTWVGENNLKENGVFKDSYFADLADRLEAKNKVVAIIPGIYGIKRSFADALKWFRKSKSLFIIPEDYYRLSDYIRTIFIVFRLLFFFRNEHKFDGNDLSFIFREDVSRTDLVSRANITMPYFLPKRLSQAGIKIERFIITFENMSSEKSLIMGVDKYLTGTKILGFQHPSLFPLLLSWYTSKKEAAVLPIPDKIICSGKFFKETLAREGFPIDRLVAGPAMRFQHLLNLNNCTFQQCAGSKKNVLITLPLVRSSALELLSKSWQALKDKSELSIWIKPHPLTSKDQLWQILGELSITLNSVKLVNGGMGEILSQVDILIATASATILDAVAYGVPTIRVRSDIDLSLDPMDWFSPDELQYVARTPVEISLEIKKILALDLEQLARLKNKGRELIANCFSPVTEETISVFTK